MSEQNNVETPLRLRVSVGETTVEVEGPANITREQFSALREEFLIGTGESAGDEQNSQTESTTSAPSQKQRSLGEFYQRVDDPTKQEITLLTGWYLERHENRSDFTRSEIEDMASAAKLKLGANVPRDIGNLVKNGYFDERDDRDGETTYLVTIDGEEYVENELLNTDID